MAAEKPDHIIHPKPEKPLKDDCCDSGCSPCIWDVYHDELAEWRKAKRAFECKNNLENL